MFHRFGWSGLNGVDICARCACRRTTFDDVDGSIAWVFITTDYAGRSAPACRERKAA